MYPSSPTKAIATITHLLLTPMLYVLEVGRPGKVRKGLCLGRGELLPRSGSLWCKWGPLPLICSAREVAVVMGVEWDRGRQDSEDEVEVDRVSG